jgi:uncharacterized repeat protein (TIGR03803 family)
MKSRGLILAALLVVAATTARAQTFTVLYNFGSKSGDPLNPGFQGIIAQGRNGNLYSTTSNGGSALSGDIFKITPTGTATGLHNFDGTIECLPRSGLTLGTDGNFYGTTEGCGTSMLGTVFKVTSGGSFAPLYNFAGTGDGGLPDAPPIQATDGNFYGTVRGSLTAGGSGTVYKLTLTPSVKLTTIFSFDGTHGEFPAAPLVQGTDGNFYGTTEQGGSNGAGVVFKITPAGKLTVLHNFDTTDGADPIGPLIQARDGNFYGTTEKGGTQGSGVVFKITAGRVFTILHNFNSATDGGSPFAGLVQATDLNFYGMAASGGSGEVGTIYRINAQGSFSVLHNFDNTTGASPSVTLVQHTNGKIYGVAFLGGTHGQGTFFSLNASLPPFVSLLPYSGKVGGTIEFLGQGFTSTSTVSFNGTVVKPTSLTGTFLMAPVPSGATTGFVTVTTSSGTLKSNKIFRVIPQITSFMPTSGPVGATVTINGISLRQTTSVTFGGVKATFKVSATNPDTQVTAIVPTGAVSGKITITTLGGTATSSGTFTVSTSTLTGHCEYICPSVRCPELTGNCVGSVGGSCQSKLDLVHCPIGQPAKRPGTECGVGVDLDRTCTP